MPTPGIGDPYWFEWYVGLKHIVEMLNPDNGIESVIFQHPEYDTIDDVVVEYKDDKKQICYQIKHEISTSIKHNLTFGKLFETDPDRPSKKCLLSAIMCGWDDATNSGANSIKPILYTNRTLGTNRRQRTYNGETYSAYPIGKFFELLSKNLSTVKDGDVPQFSDKNLYLQWEEMCDLLKISDVKKAVPFFKDFSIKGNQYGLEDIEKSLISTIATYFSCDEILANELFGRLVSALRKWTTSLTKSMEFQISNLSVETSEAAILLKKALSNARRERSRIRLRLESLTEDFEYKFSATTNDLSALQEFFPAVDLEKLESVEKFHKTISKIFKNEIKKECNKLTLELEDCNALIKDYEDQLEELIGNPTISKTILHRHSELIRQIDSLKLANSRYDKLTELQKNNREDKDNLDAIEKEQFAILQNTINSKMKEVNDYIYDKSCNAPIIDFSNGNYTFFTPDDTGTGIAYKGLVVFDLAVLELTPLPAIVHDSIVLKQISDTAIERILELYEKSGKQVFISLDKHNSYTEKAGKILVEKSVLCLAPNGSELFGRSWG